MTPCKLSKQPAHEWLLSGVSSWFLLSSVPSPVNTIRDKSTSGERDLVCKTFHIPAILLLSSAFLWVLGPKRAVRCLIALKLCPYKWTRGTFGTTEDAWGSRCQLITKRLKIIAKITWVLQNSLPFASKIICRQIQMIILQIATEGHCLRLSDSDTRP